jgi:hypothetical protein
MCFDKDSRTVFAGTGGLTEEEGRAIKGMITLPCERRKALK